MLFGQASLSAILGYGESSTRGIKTDKSANWATSLGITPGINYQVSKKIWLEASMNNLPGINYGFTKTDYFNLSGAIASTSKRKEFTGNANVNGFSDINYGIRWLIPKS